MADGKLTTEEYRRFIAWFVMSPHALKDSIPLNDDNIRTNPIYLEYLSSPRAGIDEFGVTTDIENNRVIAPDGTVLDYTPEEYNDLSTQEKLDLIGVMVRDGVVYLRSGEKYLVESLGLEDTTDTRAIIQAVLSLEETGEIPLYDGLSDGQIADIAAIQGITVDQWKKNWLDANFPTGGMTEWQKEQAAIERSRLAQDAADVESERQRAEWEAKQSITHDWYTAEMQRISQPLVSEADRAAEEARRNASLYQQVIDELRRELEPTDWVQKYILDIKETENPYTEAVRSAAMFNKEDTLAKIKGERSYIKAELKKLQERLKDESDDLLRTSETTALEKAMKDILAGLDIQQARIQMGQFQGADEYVKRIADMIQSGDISRELIIPLGQRGTGAYDTAGTLLNLYLQDPNAPVFQAMDKGTLQYVSSVANYLNAQAYQTKKEPTLNIPTWLQSSIVGSPQTITGMNWREAITPSAQQLTRWSPTQQKMWGSYVRASGGSVEDLLSRMESMTPKSPSLGRTWKTFSQRF